MALRNLDAVVPADDRRRERRFTPTGPLSRATVRLEPGSEPLEADIVDLSPSGMRLAVRAGVQCAEGDHCRITLELSPAQRLQLEGEIRWSQQHPHITVFGVLLDPANAPLGPV
jgi:hypothetical protein